MAKGFPDWYSPVALQGWDGSQLRPIACDAAGVLYAVMKGMKDGTLKNIAVDDAGRIIAMLYAMSNSTAVPLQTDANGNLKLNISAQDVARVLVAPSYGRLRGTAADGEIPEGGHAKVLSISGPGQICYAVIYLEKNTPLSSYPYISFHADGEHIASFTPCYLLTRGLVGGATRPITVLSVNADESDCTLGGVINFTFEDSAYLELVQYGFPGACYYLVEVYYQEKI